MVQFGACQAAPEAAARGVLGVMERGSRCKTETPELPGVSVSYDSLRNPVMTPAGQHPMHIIIGRLFRERWAGRQAA